MNAEHRGPKDCPTWYDGCHCNYETLCHNIERAEKAEAEIAQLRAEIARLRRISQPPGHRRDSDSAAGGHPMETP